MSTNIGISRGKKGRPRGRPRLAIDLILEENQSHDSHDQSNT